MFQSIKIITCQFYFLKLQGVLFSGAYIYVDIRLKTCNNRGVISSRKYVCARRLDSTRINVRDNSKKPFNMATSKMSISSVNELDYNSFIRIFGNVVEGTPLCAAAVISKRPFSSFDQFVAAMWEIVDELPDSARAGILRNHRDLAGNRESLSSDSQKEQICAGINTRNLNDEENQAMKRYNELYKKKFEFPFVMCSRLNKKDGILRQIRASVKKDGDEELKRGIGEVKKIMLLRMEDLVECEKSKLEKSKL